MLLTIISYLDAHDVGSPLTQKLSFIAIGTPSNVLVVFPFLKRSDDSIDLDRAISGVRRIIAFKFFCRATIFMH